jgi:hypothetical protein
LCFEPQSASRPDSFEFNLKPAFLAAGLSLESTTSADDVRFQGACSTGADDTIGVRRICVQRFAALCWAVLWIVDPRTSDARLLVVGG